MNDKRVNSIIKIIYIVATILILAGAIFRIQHYANGSSIFFTGFIIGTVATIFNTIRLKKKSKNLEKQFKQKE